jgi:hypothetical protein
MRNTLYKCQGNILQRFPKDVRNVIIILVIESRLHHVIKVNNPQPNSASTRESCRCGSSIVQCGDIILSHLIFDWAKKSYNYMQFRLLTLGIRTNNSQYFLSITQQSSLVTASTFTVTSFWDWPMAVPELRMLLTSPPPIPYQSGLPLHSTPQTQTQTQLFLQFHSISFQFPS